MVWLLVTPSQTGAGKNIYSLYVYLSLSILALLVHTTFVQDINIEFDSPYNVRLASLN